jgi:hypothetical protein
VRANTEQLVGTLIAVAGVVVLVAVVALLDGTLRWVLTSSALVIVLCGTGLLMDGRARAGRPGPTPRRDR